MQSSIFKTTHLILKYSKVHHASFSSAQLEISVHYTTSARIATEDSHELATNAAACIPHVFKPYRSFSSPVDVVKRFRRKNKVFLSKSPAAFPRRYSYYWSNRQFQETRWFLWRPPYCRAWNLGRGGCKQDSRPLSFWHIEWDCEWADNVQCTQGGEGGYCAAIGLEKMPVYG